VMRREVEIRMNTWMMIASPSSSEILCSAR
jgi:hypothetical protein